MHVCIAFASDCHDNGDDNNSGTSCVLKRMRRRRGEIPHLGTWTHFIKTLFATFARRKRFLFSFFPHIDESVPVAWQNTEASPLVLGWLPLAFVVLFAHRRATVKLTVKLNVKFVARGEYFLLTFLINRGVFSPLLHFLLKKRKKSSTPFVQDVRAFLIPCRPLCFLSYSNRRLESIGGCQTISSIL